MPPHWLGGRQSHMGTRLSAEAPLQGRGLLHPGSFQIRPGSTRPEREGLALPKGPEHLDRQVPGKSKHLGKHLLINSWVGPQLTQGAGYIAHKQVHAPEASPKFGTRKTLKHDAPGTPTERRLEVPGQRHGDAGLALLPKPRAPHGGGGREAAQHLPLKTSFPETQCELGEGRTTALWANVSQGENISSYKNTGRPRSRTLERLVSRTCQGTC